MTGGTRSRGGSRPDPTVRDRVLNAFLDQITERGLGNVSMDAIAKAAGASKATMYRRWPSKRDLILDAYAVESAPITDLPESLTLRQFVDLVFAGIDEPEARRRNRQLLAELLAALGHDGVARQMAVERHQFWRRVLIDLIIQAQDEGLVPSGRDPALLAETVAALTTLRHLYAEQYEGTAETVWRMLTASDPLDRATSDSPDRTG
ncbi:TetR/AcrR family transcriptional regulator [Ruania alkalisoli]|uniref:TetR/AcrR family transcriptional regulator n=1 Tax=Ruania alkalisoli TaxID=2779775 RepID=A0A7M1SVT7_9MICO|nr:TetR/AcrR family transcriptional regulator [Ruania alkalisoli]QOR71581.1 TetR/AcrR family transcriptional regulator [Ruania alkalisoli]